jgi:hypothetical protein
VGSSRGARLQGCVAADAGPGLIVHSYKVFPATAAAAAAAAAAPLALLLGWPDTHKGGVGSSHSARQQGCVAADAGPGLIVHGYKVFPAAAAAAPLVLLLG